MGWCSSDVAAGRFTMCLLGFSQYFHVARLKFFLKVVYSQYFKGAVSTKSVTLPLQRFWWIV